MKQTTPARHLIQELAERAALSVMCRRSGPGEFISHLSQEERDILKELTSDDVADVRPFDWL